MTSRTAARLVSLYPRRWRTRYGEEFAALLEEHPFSFKTFANTFCSAAEAHMRAAVSHQCDWGIVVGSIWSAWIAAVFAGLILYGTVDDSPLLASMNQNSIFAASWTVIQIGCILAVSAIVMAGLPLALSMGLYAMRERRRDVSLRLAVPFIAASVLIAWVAAVLISSGGHWAASPWAVAFSRPDWPTGTVRWITGSISAALLILCCFASAASVTALLRKTRLLNLRIALPGGSLQLEPLSFAAMLAPCVATGIFIMLVGVVVWGCIAIRLSATAFHGCVGPLGLTSLTAWVLSAVIFGLAALISGRAAWRSRILSADR